MIKNYKLSKNFYLYDYLKSSTAERFPEIKKQQYNPSKEIVENIVRTNELLQKIRDFHNLPIRITSGYRCLDLNNMIGSKSTSDHLTGSAADFEAMNIFGNESDGATYKRIAMYIFQSLSFSQLIKEFGTAKCPAWLHISQLKNRNKKQGLEIGAHTQNKFIPLSFKECKT